MRDLEHPSITKVNRDGTLKSFREILQAEIKANKYVEDIFGTEIKIGDDYIEDEHGQLVHRDNAFDYLCELYIKNTR